MKFAKLTCILIDMIVCVTEGGFSAGDCLKIFLFMISFVHLTDNYFFYLAIFCLKKDDFGCIATLLCITRTLKKPFFLHLAPVACNSAVHVPFVQENTFATELVALEKRTPI